MLHRCEAWVLTLREKGRLKLLENRMLRRIFGPKRDENVEWKRLHNGQLHCLYRSCLEDFGRLVNILTDTSTGKRSLGRPRRRWEDNIRMDLNEIGIFTRNWVNLKSG